MRRTLALAGVLTVVACAETMDPVSTESARTGRPDFTIQSLLASNWGLDRVDQVNLPLDNSFTYYRTGAGVYIYILDSCVLPTHNEFGGRVVYSQNFTGGTDPCDTHGTHVASIAAGNTYGVAKGASIVSLYVGNANNMGPNTITPALQYVLSDIQGHPGRRGVVNMSIGEQYKGNMSEAAMEQAIRDLVAADVVVVAAAGNDDSSTVNYLTPQRLACGDGLDGFVVVAASTPTDTRHGLSNYGSCVWIFAPGENILGASNASNSATTTLSGTSHAAPFVTGAAAQYLEAYPSASASDVILALVTRASSVISSTPSKLLYTKFIPPAPPSTVGIGSVTAVSGTVTWVNGTGYLSPIVEYRTGAGAWTASPTLAAGTTSYALSGLAPNTHYDAQVHYSAPGADIVYGPLSGGFTTLVGPAGPPSALNVTAIGSTTATLNWTNGDASATTEISDSAAGGAWISAGSVAAGVATKPLTSLATCKQYSIRLVHKRNGAYSAVYPVNAAFQTTAASGQACAPANFINSACYVTTVTTKVYNNYIVTWNNTEHGGASTWEILHNTTNNTATGTILHTGAVTIATDTLKNYRVIAGQPPEYVWIRHKLSGGSTSSWVPLNTFPFTYTTRCDL